MGVPDETLASFAFPTNYANTGRYEGTHDLTPAIVIGPGSLTFPVHEYSHGNGNGAIIGGYVYRGDVYARMQGIYYFGDLSSGRI